MDKVQSLADFLGIDPNRAEVPSEPGAPRLEDIADSKAFALAVLDSREFRQYIVSGLTLGDLPGFTSVLGRLMDYAWGKSPDRVEHTGKDGQPIETITEVRRVIVRVLAPEDEKDIHPTVTH